MPRGLSDGGLGLEGDTDDELIFVRELFYGKGKHLP